MTRHPQDLGPTRSTRVLALFVFGAALVACSDKGKAPASGGLTGENHTAFPIGVGTVHALGIQLADTVMACESCHGPASGSFTQFSCVDCHDHAKAITDQLHLGQPAYTFTSAGCFSCHPGGARVPFTHAGITKDCGVCHDTGSPYAALPKAGIVHVPTSGADCGTCHTVAGWQPATGAPGNSRDPAHDLSLTTLVPTFVDVKISALTPRSEVLPMTMNHQSNEAPSAAFSACKNCHANAAAAVYTSATFHASLAKLNLAEPTACASCHADAMPTGFVGPTANNPARVPASGGMKHDAVAWVNNLPTATRLVSQNCGICHAPPSPGAPAPWTMSLAGKSPALYHAALSKAAEMQPVTCLDCHANTRPQALLTSATASIPVGSTFEHGWAMGDCLPCHQDSAKTNWTSWSGAKFHITGSTNPTTCLPCHANSAPTSTVGWLSTTYAASPFDYGTNSQGVAHGGGQDCALCHTGPGTGAWGGQPNWVGGHYGHQQFTLVDTTCLACHASQRPDLLPGTTPAQVAALIGFDHAPYAKLDCIGCHSATVAAGSYVNYFNPTTAALPGGDWKDAQGYPGSTPVGFPYERIELSTTALNYSAATGLVTSTSVTTRHYFDVMVHTSNTIPPELRPGPVGDPDFTRCWHCHVNVNGVVTDHQRGKFHDSLARYTEKLGAAETPIPQPVSGCNDCHVATQPIGIVQANDSSLVPMDHAAEFAATVTIGASKVSKVSELDCSTCHHDPLGLFTDGVLHASIGAAALKDCVTCHYVTMADTAIADVTSGTVFSMKHMSAQLTFQTCDTCHATALAKSSSPTVEVESWKPGVFHASLSVQPAGCVDCHAISQPAAGTSTQSTVRYTMPAGATASNGAQWMNHGSASLTGKDCAACHLSDAKRTGSAWSKSTPFHAVVAGVTTCQECHGLSNGGGSVPGTNNNLPSTVTPSATLTRASAASGVPASTLAQVSHTDTNAATRDCGFCHTQLGPATAPAVTGKEWAQARVHTTATGVANILVMNGTTGRCGNCHLNEKPGAAYATLDHGGFTNASGSTDCSNCHTFPGTGTQALPNWLGASNSPK